MAAHSAERWLGIGGAAGRAGSLFIFVSPQFVYIIHNLIVPPPQFSWSDWGGDVL